jgi:hypothetical protein
MENNQTPPAHTTTAWWYEEFDDDLTGNEPFIIREAREPAGSDGGVRAIATVMMTDSREDAEAKAAFIVRACNAHEDLTRELAVAVTFLERLDPDAIASVQHELDQALAIESMRAALTKAHGNLA